MELGADAHVTSRNAKSVDDASGVTVRRLLSHTAGVNNGDFEGFLPEQEMQSLVEFMTRPADGGAHGNVRLDQFEPGTSMRSCFSQASQARVGLVSPFWPRRSLVPKWTRP